MLGYRLLATRNSLDTGHVRRQLVLLEEGLGVKLLMHGRVID